MIIHNNGLPIKIVGNKNSTSTQECYNFFKKEIAVDIIDFEVFLNLEKRNKFQFTVPFFKDVDERKKILKIIQDEELNCPSYIDNSCVIWTEPEKVIGRGCLLSHFVSLYQDSKLGDHTVIESYSMVGHYTTVGDNVHASPGVMIAGKTTIGNECYFGLRSTVLNGLNLCTGVHVGAVSTISKDITIPGKYVGSPARRIGD